MHSSLLFRHPISFFSCLALYLLQCSGAEASSSRRPRRDSDLSEPESMMSEKLKGHQQLLTPTRTTPPSKTSAPTKTPPSTEIGAKKRPSSGSGSDNHGKMEVGKERAVKLKSTMSSEDV